MLRFALLAVAGATLVAGAARSQEAQPTQDESAKEKKICRSVVATGSIMPKRYCLTSAEWKRIHDLNENGSAEYHRNRRVIGCGKVGGLGSCE